MPSPTSSGGTSNVGQSGSLDINALLAGTKWGGATGTGATLTYSFPWTTSSSATFSGANGVGNYSSLNEPNASTHYGLNATQQAAASSALQAWANVANLTFSQVADTSSNVGDIRFAWTSVSNKTSTGQQAWGWASFPSSVSPEGGDVWISTLSSGATNTDWSVGSYNFLSLIHELGHALGLKHSFEGTPVLPSSQESRLYSVMSYTDAPNCLFVQVTHNSNGSTSWKSFSVEPDTPMLYDVAAMQYMYGANMSYNTGDNVYTFDPSKPFFRTIWDAGGTDTISVANFTKGCTIDLQAGHFSKITIESDSTAGYNWTAPPPTPTYDGTNNLCIAYGVTIENAIGGSGNDTLIGNDANNSLTGGAGSNSLDGGAGIDTAIYASARSSYTVTKGTNWTVKANTAAGGGTDTLANIERLQFSNDKVALDMGVTQSGGEVALLIGAVLGNASLSNKALVGQLLAFFDPGNTMHDAANVLVSSGVMDQLAGGSSTSAYVNLIFHAVTGQVATPDVTAKLGNFIDGGIYTKADFLATVADLQPNLDNVGLVGLATTGLEFS